jgi:ATP-dependent HslUV protease ATP-binding subunit HslU
VIERLLDQASFEAADIGSDASRRVIVVDAEYVDKQLGELVQDEDLTRFIL